MTGRTIVLGLDTIDLRLVERWVAEGRLPFFAQLLQQVPLVRLSVVSRVLQGSLWPTLLTGRSPGHHGSYYSPALTRNTYHLDRVRAEQMTCEPFYLRLGDRGIRCGIADVPTDQLRQGLSGVQVVDWGTEFHYAEHATSPPELREQIEQEIGRHFMDAKHVSGTSIAEHLRLAQNLLQGVRMKGALASKLLANRDLDLVFVVFGEPHKAGHFLWKYMDPAHPDHVEVDPRLRDGMLAVYQLIDAELARLAATLSPQDNLIVLSDMGIQANYRGEHFVDALLLRLGLCGSASATRLDRDSHELPWSARLKGAVRGTLGTLVRHLTPKSLQARLRRNFGAAASIDWTRTQVFALPTDRNTYLRVNLKGREPQGVVDPGAAYDALLDRIEREFRSLVNVATGQPAVEAVFRVRELFPGERADDLPDVAILWNAAAPLDSVESLSLGRFTLTVQEARSGNHREEGFLLARGPAFRTGPADLAGHILQVAPTLLALHGVAAPATYEMQALDVLLPVTPSR